MAGTYDPIAAAVSGGPMSLNLPWYEELLATKSAWTHAETHAIRPNSGIAFEVPAGHTFRITQGEGPQINDINLFGADIVDAGGERFDLGYTIAIEGMLMPRFSRAWSNLPTLRPMATVIDDNIDATKVPEGTWPIWMGGHCSPEVVQSETGVVNHFACHSNFMEAARSRGLPESVAAFNNINLFQPMGFIQREKPGGGITHTIAGQPSVSAKGEFVEFYAEIDLLVLAVHCPYGDQTTGPREAAHFTNIVDIYDTGRQPQPGPQWHEWRPAWEATMERYESEGEPPDRPRTFG